MSAQGLKILIVEDDEMLRRMYSFIFGRDGYAIEDAITGPQAIEKAKATKPNAILLDIMIPDMNGIEVLKTLKEDPDTRSIPVIMLSNLTSDEYINQAKNAGAALYIIKSDHEPGQILTMVNQLLGV